LPADSAEAQIVTKVTQCSGRSLNAGPAWPIQLDIEPKFSPGKKGLIMKKLHLTILALSLLPAGAAFAVDSGAVLGGAIGGGAGAAVGSEIGGREGAIVGGALGGAVGAAIGADDDDDHKSKKHTKEVIYVEEHHHHHSGPPGRAYGHRVPPGHAKHKKHKHH
jgi:hypothetical protein